MSFFRKLLSLPGRVFNRLSARWDFVSSIIDAVGFRRTLVYIASYYLTSPRLWERFFVAKIHGAKLQKSLRDILSYESDALVSVILPVNNGRSKGVERLVESLKAQSHKNVEYIAVDSGSTDDTVEYLTRVGFQVIQIPPEQFTHAFSRNTGAEAARGEYLLFVVDDAIFHDTDWIKNALAILNYYQADSISTSQVVDEGADHYARLLSYYLSTAQSNLPSINVSKNNWLTEKVRPLLPLRALFRSVCIDDTNHLARKKTFDRLKFQAPTVEDIDYALRLTASGGRVVYTNLLSITHYHKYSLSNIDGYARRVYIDAKQMSRWAKTNHRLYSRDAFLLGAYHVLAKIYRAVDQYKWRYLKGQKNKMPLSMHMLKSLAGRIKAELGAGVAMVGNYRDNYYKKAGEMFGQIVGREPPSGLFFNAHAYYRFAYGFNDSVDEILKAFSFGVLPSVTIDDIELIMLYHWVQRLSFIVGSGDVFDVKYGEYDFDKWDMSSWR